MNQDSKKKIVSSLQAQVVNQPCPRCTKVNFEVVGQTSVPLNDNPATLTLGGPALPTAIIACSNCGFLTLHALSALNIQANESITRK